jgi:hypothetical protein
MVCRASAGSSAPAVGARLQVCSGLTGESIARRQLLRCDNAETDPRVNLEACRALGIASIVVLPLLRRNGDVRGLFELFSDHAYAFEERDLIALERMAGLTLTALDLAERRQNSAPAPAPKREAEKPVESSSCGSGALPRLDGVESRPHTSSTTQAAAIPLNVLLNLPRNISLEPEAADSTVLPAEPPVISPSPVTAPEAAPASVPEAMLRMQKCASCGFPISEGRTLCLDCEKKDSEKKDLETKQPEREPGQIGPHQIEPRHIEQEEVEQQEILQSEQEQDTPSASAAPVAEDFVPAFLANSVPARESWLANHVNLLAIVVLILGVLVAIVVFR